MSHSVRTLIPEHTRTSRSLSRSSGYHTTNLLDRINAAETRSARPRSRTGSLILAERDHRSTEEINAEIAALEAEARANKWERKADAERGLAMNIRDRPFVDEIEVIKERKYVRPRDEVVLYERARSLPREEYILVRPKSPPRDIIRVAKDRKGRMSLVRSAH